MDELVRRRCAVLVRRAQFVHLTFNLSHKAFRRPRTSAGKNKHWADRQDAPAATGQMTSSTLFTTAEAHHRMQVFIGPLYG